MSDVDIIILDIDGGEMLQSCIDALSRQTRPPAKVIVFDNGSATPASDRLSDSQPRGFELRIIRSERNAGFVGGNNEALLHSTAPLVALVNNDVILDESWVETMAEAFDAEPELGAVQSIIRRDAATIDGAGIDVSDGTIRQVGHGRAIGARLPDAWGVSATATVYRRAAIGDRLFDPRFFAYYEDVELCARLHEQGWTTRVLPVALATHIGSQSAAMLGGDALRLRTRNRYFVARMHPGVGRIPALLLEDARLLLKGQSSLGGVWAGLTARL